MLWHDCDIISHLRDPAVNHDKLFEMWSQQLTIKQVSLGRKRMTPSTLYFFVALHTQRDSQAWNPVDPYFLRI